MDPIADKILIVFLLFAIAVNLTSYYVGFLSAAIIAREIWVGALRDFNARQQNSNATKVTFLAKIKTTIQLFTISTYLLGLAMNNMIILLFADIILLISFIVTVYTGWFYTLNTFRGDLLLNEGNQNIAIIGVGYVGMSLAVLLSQNHSVNIYDIDEKKLGKIDQKVSPIKDDLIDEYLNTKNLELYTKSSIKEAVKNVDIIIVSTPTDYDENKNFFDTDSVDKTIDYILKVNNKAFIVIKSTLPEGHTEYLKTRFNTEKIIFSPEFLREGNALYDNLYPSRIIVGSKCQNAQIFANMLKQASLKCDTKVLLTSSREAESIKLFL